MALYKLITSFKTKEKIPIESELIKEATSEWDILLRNVNEETIESIAIIGKLIHNVTSQRNNFEELLAQAQTAEKVFMNIVDPIYKKKKETQKQQPTPNTDLRSTDSTRSKNGDPTDEQQTKYVSRITVINNTNEDQLPTTCDSNWNDAQTVTKGACAEGQTNDKKNQIPSTIDKGSERSSNTDPKTSFNAPKRADLKEHFAELHDNEWIDAHGELLEQLKYEDKTVTLLLDILQNSYETNTKESKTQIEQMERSAKILVEYGKVEIKTTTNQSANKDIRGDISLLIQYRKDNAGHAVRRLQETFRNENFRQICSKYGVKPTAKHVVEYADRCVELTWWMLVQDPPLSILFHDNLKKVDNKLYKPFTRKGKEIKFIVWPALYKSVGGILLAEGTAEYTK